MYRPAPADAAADSAPALVHAVTSRGVEAIPASPALQPLCKELARTIPGASRKTACHTSSRYGG